MSHQECALGVIRAFLRKKGYSSALEELDRTVVRRLAVPRRPLDVDAAIPQQVPDSMSTSSSQSKALHMSKMLRANKGRDKQFRSIAEILVAYYLAEDCVPGGDAEPAERAQEQVLQPPSAGKGPLGGAAPGAPSAPGGGAPDTQQEAPSAVAAAISSALEAPATASAPTFTAPDGKTFTDRNAFRRYVFQTFYTFTDREGETLRKNPGEIDGQPFNLENLRACRVLLLDHSEQIQVDDVVDSEVFIGPSCESVFLRDCSNSTFTVACKQLRTRDCHNCKINLYSLTDPVVEASTDMAFAPFNGAYPGLGDHFLRARLEPTVNRWRSVFDFHKDDDTYPMPHFTLTEELRPEWRVDDVPGGGDPANPVPVLPPPPEEGAEGAGDGAHAGDGGVFMSFAIDTTAKEAERRIEEAMRGRERQE